MRLGTPSDLAQVVFAIVGMMMFGGMFGACTDESITTQAECVEPPSSPLAAISMAEVTGGGDAALGDVPLEEITTDARRQLLGSAHPGEHALVLKALLPTVTVPSNESSAFLLDADDRATVKASPPQLPVLESSALPLAMPLVAAASREASLEALGARSQAAVSHAHGSPEWRQAKVARGRALHTRRKEMGLRRRGRSLKGGGSDSDTGNDGLPIEWLNPAFGSFDDFGQSMLILYVAHPNTSSCRRPAHTPLLCLSLPSSSYPLNDHSLASLTRTFSRAPFRRYVASTGDGWEEFMWAGMDVTGIGLAPVRNDHSFNSFFFIAWMIVGSFVALNLFVGTHGLCSPLTPLAHSASRLASPHPLTLI